MITTKINVNRIDYIDYQNLQVTKTISDSNKVSNYTVELDSPYGRHKSDFSVGNDILIYSSKYEDLTASQAGYWNFNEGTGTLAANSINSNNGTLISGAGWAKGIVGSAVNLTSAANNFVSIPHTQDVSISGPFTVSIWAKRLGNSTDPYGAIVEKATGFSDRNYNFRWADAGSIIFRVRDSDGTDRECISTPILDDDWHNIIGVFTGGTAGSIRLYVDTSGTSWTSLIGSVTTNTADIRLGRLAYDTDNNYHFSGLLDEFRIFPELISDTQIGEIYSIRDEILLRGIVENVQFRGDGIDQKLVLRGRDYTARLLDNTVDPVVYTNTEIGSIVKDIIKNNLTDIGSNNVGNTGVILERIAFKHNSIFDAFKQLGDLAGYCFYVDEDKDLNFIPCGSANSNTTFDSNNIIKMNFDRSREGFANKIWVYGDRTLVAAPTEILNVGSPNDGGNLGSVFTLLNKPHNTNISILGSVRIGGIFNMTSSNISGAVYLVNYEDRQLIFPSGTSFGYYLPPSGGSIVTNYDRSVPIAKYGEDQSSISAYGPKELVIDDKTIKDPVTAEKILAEKLSLSTPLNNIDVSLQGWYTFAPGQTALVNVPDFNINQDLPIIEINYNFDKDSVNSEDILSVNLDNRSINLTDKLKDISQRLSLLEANDQDESDTLTRLQYATGSINLVGSYWNASTRTINDSFVESHPHNGILGIVGSQIFVGSIISGVDTIWTSGIMGIGYDKALTFGSPMRISIPNHIEMQKLNSGGTFTSWFRYGADQQNPNGSIAMIYDAAGTGLSGLNIQLALINTGSHRVVFQYFSGTSSASSTMTTQATFRSGVWYHIAAVWDRVWGGSLYIDGSGFAKSVVPSTQLGIDKQANTYFGANTPGTVRHLSGILDDIRLYNRGLTAEEIGSIYNKQNINGSLLAYYKLDEGTSEAGSFVYSSASGGNSAIQPFLGDRRSALSVIRSGGYYD